jgi:hypothetical protein
MSIPGRPKKEKQARYSELSGNDMVQAEGLVKVIHHMDNVYNQDPIDPRGNSSVPPPPVRVVKAIYGINRPTEVGAIYIRKQAIVIGSEHITQNIFAPDRDVSLLESQNNTNNSKQDAGFMVKGGLVFETPSESQNKRSGDGTVPYWSLNHVVKWQSDTQKVIVDEIPGAEHREILADKRLHRLLIDYCCAKESVPVDNTV